MAQWTVIDPNTLLPGDPWTSAKAQAAFENLEAVTEGAPGAPRVNGLALGGVYLGSLFRQGTTSPIGINDIGDFETLVLSGGLSSEFVEIRFSSDNGVNFGAWQQIGIGPGVQVGDAVILKSEGETRFRGARVDTAGSSTSTRSLTIPSAANSFQLRNSVSLTGTFFSVSVYLIGGTP